MDMNVQERISLNGEADAVVGYLKVLIEGKWILSAIAVVAVLGTYIALKIAVPVYRATSTLQIELKQPKLLDSAALYDGGVESWGYFNTQIAILRSRTLLERVAGHIDWRNYPDILRAVAPSGGATVEEKWQSMNKAQQESLMRLIQSGVHIEHVATTQLLQIHYQGSNPEFASDVANTLAAIYIESDADPLVDVTNRAEAWLGARLDEARTQLMESESQLQAFRESLDVVSYNGARGELLEALNDYLRRQRDQQRILFSFGLVYESVIQSKDDVEKLQKIPELANEEYVHAAKQMVLDAEATLVDLKAKGGSVEIAQAEKALEQSRDVYAREVMAAADYFRGKYEMAKKVDEHLQQLVSMSRKELRGLDRESYRWALLTRDVETNNKLYQSLLTRYKQLDVAGDYTQHKARVIEFAVAPHQAFLPNKSRSLGFSAFFGVLIGVAVVFFRHMYAVRRKAV